MLAVLGLVLTGITSYSQDLEAEVPGDNFSLEGALELFKKSESPEHFEKLLNSPDSKVNNLDLNGDGYIDYIRVFDRYEGNVHAFILQAVISDRESQDIAVIELEKLSNGKAVLQIVGDADIYGVETIIEPTTEVRTYAGTTRSTTVVNVWAWPSVQYVYGPYYSAWYSPWGWHAYPIWWHSWSPIAYVHYHPIYIAYQPYYSYCHTRRIVYAHHIYSPYRTTSVVVYSRHRDQITHYRSSNRDGGYRHGYARQDRGRNYSVSPSSTDQGNDFQRSDNRGNSRTYSRSGNNVSPGRSDINTGRRTEEFKKSNFTREQSSQRNAKTLSTGRETRQGTSNTSTYERRPVSRDHQATQPNRNSSTFSGGENRSNSAPQSRETRQSTSGQRETRTSTTNESNSSERRAVNRERQATQSNRNSSTYNSREFRSSPAPRSRETQSNVSRSMESQRRTYEAPRQQNQSRGTSMHSSPGRSSGSQPTIGRPQSSRPASSERKSSGGNGSHRGR
jgi:hypothetical protein